MKKKLANPKKQQGQSVIEFILVIFVFLTFFFMYMKLALGFAVGHYIQYATFMAARSYYAGALDENTQKAAGEAAIKSYLGDDGNRFRSIVRAAENSGQVGGGPQFVATNADTYWQQGASYTFKFSMYLLPLVTAARSRASREGMEVTSESWLNRDPSYEECVRDMTQSRNGNQNAWLFDNGC